MPDHRVHIIGVGAGGTASLAHEALQLVNRAELIFGGGRLLKMFPSITGEKIAIKNNLTEISNLLRENLGLKRMVVLASGDPNFFGIARYLTEKLDKDAVEIVPNVSAMQLAFARVKESWDDAALASVHAKPVEDIVALVRASHKIGIFTDDKHTPGEIARVLQASGIENCRAYVCEELGTEDERVTAADLYSLKDRDFSPLNVLILLRECQETGPQPRLGIPDESFHRRREGLITKLEVRAVSLAKMALTNSSTVWDIGAGSGAVAIEASLLADSGSVFAIERDADAISVIRENVKKFNRHNIKVVQASAPDNLEGLPDTDVIFIGGSGGRMTEILSLAEKRLKPEGRVVINAATLESLHGAVEALSANGFTSEVTLVNMARSKDVSNLTRLEALNPVFVITAWRAKEVTSSQYSLQ